MPVRSQPPTFVPSTAVPPTVVPSTAVPPTPPPPAPMLPAPALPASVPCAAQAALFDLDGTLIDTSELIVASYQYVAQSYLGRALDPETEIYPTYGEPLAATFAHWQVAVPIDDLLAAFRRIYLANHDRYVRPCPGGAALLAQLHTAGLGVAVVTSKLAALARRGLELCGLAEQVDVLVGADEPITPKPSPAPLQLALARLGGVPSERAAMVGDSPFDLRAAHAAGARAFAVGWSVYPRQRLLAEQPEAILASFEELPAYLGL